MRRDEQTTTAREDLVPAAASRVEPHLFLVLEAEQPFRPSSRHRLGDLMSVTLARGAPAAHERRRGELVLRVDDPRMSGRHARLARSTEGWTLEDAGSKNGTFLNAARVARALLRDGDVVECGRSFFLFRLLPPAAGEPDDVVSSELAPAAEPLATLSPPLAQKLELLARIATSDVPVGLTGESGSGKELVARAVHELSRRPGALVAVNCGAIPDGLVEAELFGARKGAYSGAVADRPGLVRGAHRGTLFLDEIGDLPLGSQAALLRVLQERQVIPVGGSEVIRVDFRLITATHRDLDAAVRAGTFRQDLLARIGGFSLALPPLRERREDLGILLRAILTRDGAAPGLTLHPVAARALLRHAWPLNIRELERCLVTAAVLARGGLLEPEHLPPAVLDEPTAPARPRALSGEDAELRARLEALLVEHDGNVSAVARAMGRERVQIHRWIRRFGLDLAGFRGP